METIRVPSLHETRAAQARLRRWLVQPGEPMRPGQIVAELEVNGTPLSVAAPPRASGLLRAQLCPEGAVVPGGFILALAGAAEEPLDAELYRRENASLLHRQSDDPTVAFDGDSAAELQSLLQTPPAAVTATPEAQVLAASLGLDLAVVARTLGRSELGAEDLRRYAARKAKP